MDSIVFDRAAGFYDNTRGFPPGEEAHAAATIAQAGGLTEHSRVLEIGVGTGRIALPLSAKLRRMFGMDLSVPMMQQLRQKPDSEKVGITQADARHLPYPSDYFDTVVAVHVFHLIPDMHRALDEVRRVLKPGAPLLHCYQHSDNPIMELRRGIREQHDDLLDNKRFKRIPDEFARAGWRRIGEHNHAYTREQAPVEFIDHFRSRKWSETWRLTDAELARVGDALEAMARERFDDLETPIIMPTTFQVDVMQPPQ